MRCNSTDKTEHTYFTNLTVSLGKGLETLLLVYLMNFMVDQTMLAIDELQQRFSWREYLTKLCRALEQRTITVFPIDTIKI